MVRLHCPHWALAAPSVHRVSVRRFSGGQVTVHSCALLPRSSLALWTLPGGGGGWLRRQPASVINHHQRQSSIHLAVLILHQCPTPWGVGWPPTAGVQAPTSVT